MGFLNVWFSVIASEAKQSHCHQRDCFVATLLAMTIFSVNSTLTDH